MLSSLHLVRSVQTIRVLVKISMGNGRCDEMDFNNFSFLI